MPSAPASAGTLPNSPSPSVTSHGVILDAAAKSGVLVANMVTKLLAAGPFLVPSCDLELVLNDDSNRQIDQAHVDKLVNDFLEGPDPRLVSPIVVHVSDKVYDKMYKKQMKQGVTSIIYTVGELPKLRIDKKYPVYVAMGGHRMMALKNEAVQGRLTVKGIVVKLLPRCMSPLL